MKDLKINLLEDDEMSIIRGGVSDRFNCVCKCHCDESNEHFEQVMRNSVHNALNYTRTSHWVATGTVVVDPDF